MLQGEKISHNFIHMHVHTSQGSICITRHTQKAMKFNEKENKVSSKLNTNCVCVVEVSVICAVARCIYCISDISNRRSSLLNTWWLVYWCYKPLLNLNTIHLKAPSTDITLKFELSDRKFQKRHRFKAKPKNVKRKWVYKCFWAWIEIGKSK